MLSFFLQRYQMYKNRISIFQIVNMKIKFKKLREKRKMYQLKNIEVLIVMFVILVLFTI
jgi:hypothetical protein